jgi:hypothetical protein
MRRNLPSSLPTGTVNSRSRPSSSPSGKPELRGTGQRRRWNLEFDGPHSSTVVRTTSAALHAPLADASPNARASVADFDPCPHVGSMAEPSSAAPSGGSNAHWPSSRQPAQALWLGTEVKRKQWTIDEFIYIVLLVSIKTQQAYLWNRRLNTAQITFSVRANVERDRRSTGPLNC